MVSEDERLYSIKAIRYVTDAFVSRGSGLLDFEAEFRALNPDIFLVNADQQRAGKSRLVRGCGSGVCGVGTRALSGFARALDDQPPAHRPDAVPHRSGGRLAGSAVRC